MKNQDKITSLSKYLPFWDKLSESEKETLTSHSALNRYDKGALIHSGESKCVGVLLIKSGSIRVYMLSEEGKEITLYRLTEGDVCVLSASCVLSQITFDVSIEAISDCEIIQISSPVFSELVKNNIYVENYTYKQSTERFSDVMWAMQQILFMSFDKRLAIFLLDESAKSNSNELRMTHEQIAKYMGSAREVVTRMLKYFSNEGLVELSRGGITILDRRKLMALT